MIEIRREEQYRLNENCENELASVGFFADTHWSDAVVEVYMSSIDGKPKLSWGSRGGTKENEYTQIEIADVMLRAFELAKEELEKLNDRNCRRKTIKRNSF